MIDNVVLIVTGTLHERDVQELLEKCHPLGMFDRYRHFNIIFFFMTFFLHFIKSSFLFLYPQHCYPGSCTEYAGALQIGAC